MDAKAITFRRPRRDGRKLELLVHCTAVISVVIKVYAERWRHLCYPTHATERSRMDGAPGRSLLDGLIMVA